MDLHTASAGAGRDHPGDARWRVVGPGVAGQRAASASARSRASPPCCSPTGSRRRSNPTRSLVPTAGCSTPSMTTLGRCRSRRLRDRGPAGLHASAARAVLPLPLPSHRAGARRAADPDRGRRGLVRPRRPGIRAEAAGVAEDLAAEERQRRCSRPRAWPTSRDRPIAPAVIESCLSRIFLPNARAIEPESREAYERLGLNARQIETIARAVPKRDYWFQSAAGCRLFELALGPVALAICGASSAEELAAIDRAAGGDRKRGLCAVRGFGCSGLAVGGGSR